jgi:chitin disaccharide deacetylase
MPDNNPDIKGDTQGRFLIVNADDFGLSPGVNKGIIEAHKKGIVTSASLMVRGISAPDAVACNREQSSLSLGLHFEIYEWTYRNDEWIPLYEVAPWDDAVAVKNELSKQLERFHQIVGRNPTHLDSHQHAHRSEPVKSVLLETGDKLGIPVRHFSQKINYNGNFYGQTAKGEPYPEGISVEALIEILRALPLGVTELGCHPGLDNDLDTMYVYERVQEVKALCDPRVKSTLTAEKIKLISFSDIAEYVGVAS